MFKRSQVSAQGAKVRNYMGPVLIKRGGGAGKGSEKKRGRVQEEDLVRGSGA